MLGGPKCHLRSFCLVIPSIVYFTAFPGSFYEIKPLYLDPSIPFVFILTSSKIQNRVGESMGTSGGERTEHKDTFHNLFPLLDNLGFLPSFLLYKGKR